MTCVNAGESTLLRIKLTVGIRGSSDKGASSDTIGRKLETPSGAKDSGTTKAESPVEACVVGIKPARHKSDDRMGEGVGSDRNVH